MSRKTRILTLALGGVCCFGVSKASAQFLPGNEWPNPDLSVVAPTGVDQVYSYYNGTHANATNPGPYVPNTVGDKNPRPAGWHRGGGDFGTTSTPAFCYYNSPGNVEGEGTAPAPPPPGPGLAGGTPGYALEVSDSSVSGYGEWFSDWNALPASVQANPTETFYLRFWYQNTSIEPRGDTFRVSAYFGNSVGNETLTNTTGVGNSTDFGTGPEAGQPGTNSELEGGAADNTTWTEGDLILNAPAGAQSMKITIDSGGTSAATGNLWVSDISVSEVPEPTCIAGIGAGSMLLLARRRRSQAAV